MKKVALLQTLSLVAFLGLMVANIFFKNQQVFALMILAGAWLIAMAAGNLYYQLPADKTGKVRRNMMIFVALSVIFAVYGLLNLFGLVSYIIA